FVQLQSEGGGGSGVRIKWINPVTNTNEPIPSSNLFPITSLPATAVTGIAVADNADRGSNYAIVRWAETTTNELGFKVEYSTDPTFATGVVTRFAAINATSIILTGLNPETTYHVRVTPY